MTTYYVGPGGSDSNNGQSWANRKLTLNGAEDIPVSAGDTVYVGPGTYRESLTLDVSGSSGQPITYVGDVTGEYTDGVGGEVRITGSNDDKTETRSEGILVNNVTRDYRTFRGLRFDMHSTANIRFVSTYGCDNWIIEDCVFTPSVNAQDAISFPASIPAGETITIRRCLFNTMNTAIYLWAVSERSISMTIENCVFLINTYNAIDTTRVYGMTFKNCSFLAASQIGGLGGDAIDVSFVTSGNQIYFYNCIIYKCRYFTDNTNTIIEDHTFYVPNTTDAACRFNVSKGSNSITRNILIAPQLLLEGHYFQNTLLDFLPESAITQYGCANTPPSDDFYGITRPTTDSKKTRGAIQYNAIQRETSTVPAGELESIKMPDAGEHHIFIPITGKKMTFSLEVHRETNYAGTNPQMIIKQPGQSDDTTTDVGSSGQFNELSTSLTPASTPPYVVLVFKSNNTATSGNYATYFGKFEVT